MPKRQAKKPSVANPPDEPSIAQSLRDDSLRTKAFGQIASALPYLNCTSEKEQKDVFELAAHTLDAMAPRDEVERMLITQMISTNNRALECDRLASLPGQTFEGAQLYLRYGERLKALYVRQMEALKKYRGGGQQQMTVEHVHINEGAQAVVGQVNSKGGGERTE